MVVVVVVVIEVVVEVVVELVVENVSAVVPEPEVEKIYVLCRYKSKQLYTGDA